MATLNQVTLIGYVGNNPRVATTQNGRKVVNFTLATTEKGYTSKTGAQCPDRTEWHNIVIWGSVAEVAEKYLSKGSLVFVQGKIRTRTFEDKNGIKRYITEIEGETMQMLDRKTDNNNTDAVSSLQQSAQHIDSVLPF